MSLFLNLDLEFVSLKNVKIYLCYLAELFFLNVSVFRYINKEEKQYQIKNNTNTSKEKQ